MLGFGAISEYPISGIPFPVVPPIPAETVGGHFLPFTKKQLAEAAAKARAAEQRRSEGWEMAKADLERMVRDMSGQTALDAEDDEIIEMLLLSH